MEYIRGLNLRSYIRSKDQRRLGEPEAKRLFSQILEGVAYCHGLSITHRDIKLENILVTREGQIKIIDFGFSTCFPNSQKIKLFCGTPSYMAPEIVSKREYSGPPADIWALGVLLYTMLTGSFPFKGVSDRDLYKKIVHGKFYVPEQLSRPVRSLLASIFSLNPDRRPTAAQLLSHEWLRDESRRPAASLVSRSSLSPRPAVRQSPVGKLNVTQAHGAKRTEKEGSAGKCRTFSEVPTIISGEMFLDEEAVRCMVNTPGTKLVGTAGIQKGRDNGTNEGAKLARGDAVRTHSAGAGGRGCSHRAGRPRDGCPIIA